MTRYLSDTTSPGFGLTTTTNLANSDEERHRAALFICARATDHDDARRLLEALGLTTTGEGK